MMTPGAPAISVLLPVRNGMPYLPLAIESLRSQTFRDFEVIVVDDHSTDGTAAYLRGLDDRRFRIESSRGPGLAAALNTGLELARASCIARQDADDWSAPDRLERQRSWLTAHPDIDVLASSVSFVDERGEPVDSLWTRAVREGWDAATGPDDIAALMPLTCCIFHATVLARTSVLRRAGGYDQAMVPAEDYDLWLRLLPAHRFARLPDRLYTVRMHASSSSTVHRAEQTERVIAAKLRFLRRQIPGLPRPARLALPCDDRGAALFRRVGPSEGFVEVAGGMGTPGSGADVVAVTDFSAVSRYQSILAPEAGYRQFGNLFVRQTERLP